MEITNRQNQIIYGTLLGNGYISRSSPIYLGISESHDHNWLFYKGMELESLEARTPTSPCGKVLKWRSKSDSAWNLYSAKFYNDNRKKVDMDVLDQLRDIALAVWFGDKGFWYSNRRIGLRTTAFQENNHVIWSYFNEVGMPCDMKIDSHGATRIVFDREGTMRFLGTIAHCLPDFMLYRLEPNL
jgi:hypothetical protein